jgi:hypothetical protein
VVEQRSLQHIGLTKLQATVIVASSMRRRVMADY